MTIGAESLVSQPSTSTWKANTIAIDSQYWRRPNTPVRSQNSSTAAVSSTDSTARAVYSGIAGLPPRRAAAQQPEHGADRLVGEQPADRDDDEEHQLLEGHPQRQQDAGGVALAVGPVPAHDAEDVPGDEQCDHRQQRHEEPHRAAVDARPEDELERQRDEEAPRHEQQVLVAVHRSDHPGRRGPPGLAALGAVGRRPR